MKAIAVALFVVLATVARAECDQWQKIATPGIQLEVTTCATETSAGTLGCRYTREPGVWLSQNCTLTTRGTAPSLYWECLAGSNGISCTDKIPLVKKPVKAFHYEFALP
jgi:hypothetical protein